MDHLFSHLLRVVAPFALFANVALPVNAANWSVARVNHMLLTPPGGVTVREMSGVTYVGPADGDAHRFIAAEQTKKELVQFDATFNASGGITSITNVAAISINPSHDFEGIAYTNAARNSVFLSEENNPGIREVNLGTGLLAQPELSIPTVFTANKRANRGFESLTRSPDGTVMWTANEEALTVDGAVSTPSAGSTVRLLKLNVAGNFVTAGSQYAYQVEPIHGTSTLGSPRSGLSDLVYMPDGTLLALERSVVVSTPIFLNRIFEIGFAGATDVSVGALGSGLTGQSYTEVTKQSLWSGPADASAGQNLEGLALGPRLANGSWVLLGVVDDGFNGTTDTDTLSNNTIIAFTATANPSADFNEDGDVDGDDFVRWQRNLGKTVGAFHSQGDADRDGDVDAADLTRWKTHYTGAPIETAAVHTPEPSAALHSLCGLAALSSTGVRGNSRKVKAGEGNRTLA